MLNIWEGRSQLYLAAFGGWGFVNILVHVDRYFDFVFALDPTSKYVNSFVHKCSAPDSKRRSPFLTKAGLEMTWISLMNL
jgi:hypothetical protein